MEKRIRIQPRARYDIIGRQILHNNNAAPRLLADRCDIALAMSLNRVQLAATSRGSLISLIRLP